MVRFINLNPDISNMIYKNKSLELFKDKPRIFVQDNKGYQFPYWESDLLTDQHIRAFRKRVKILEELSNPIADQFIYRRPSKRAKVEQIPVSYRQYLKVKYIDNIIDIMVRYKSESKKWYHVSIQKIYDWDVNREYEILNRLVGHKSIIDDNCNIIHNVPYIINQRYYDELKASLSGEYVKDYHPDNEWSEFINLDEKKSKYIYHNKLLADYKDTPRIFIQDDNMKQFPYWEGETVSKEFIVHLYKNSEFIRDVPFDDNTPKRVLRSFKKKEILYYGKWHLLIQERFNADNECFQITIIKIYDWSTEKEVDDIIHRFKSFTWNDMYILYKNRLLESIGYEVRNKIY